jgi:hypothetical protein
MVGEFNISPLCSLFTTRFPASPDVCSNVGMQLLQKLKIIQLMRGIQNENAAKLKVEWKKFRKKCHVRKLQKKGVF